MGLTQRERVLSMLTEAGDEGVPTASFLREMIPRFSARIEELREAGHTIRSERVSSGSWRYTLVGDEAEPVPTVIREVDAVDDGLFDASDYNKRPRGPYDYDR